MSSDDLGTRSFACGAVSKVIENDVEGKVSLEVGASCCRTIPNASSQLPEIWVLSLTLIIAVGIKQAIDHALSHAKQ